jgi:hypothetical protein
MIAATKAGRTLVVAVMVFIAQPARVFGYEPALFRWMSLLIL